MPKHAAALAALPALLLAACGSQEPTLVENNLVAAETNISNGAAPADPAQPAASTGPVADPVPPPDAVSHPNGYLPPPPAGAEPDVANSSGPDKSPPATEDEYLRNRQAGP